MKRFATVAVLVLLAGLAGGGAYLWATVPGRLEAPPAVQLGPKAPGSTFQAVVTVRNDSWRSIRIEDIYFC